MELVNECSPTGEFIKVGTLFRTDSPYEKELMAALPLTVNALHNSEMEYHNKFGHNLGKIQNIALISRIFVSYANCRL